MPAWPGGRRATCRSTLVTIEATTDGPTVAIFGAVHGDELEGVAATRAVARHVASTRWSAGRLLLVPVANPLAFATRTRTTPSDGANLARCFPGAVDGTDTERIADVLTRNVIAGCDLLIDLHSAGVAYSMPVFAGCVGGDTELARRSVDRGDGVRRSARLAARRYEPGTQPLGGARSRASPASTSRAAEAARSLGAELATYVDGVLDVLGHYGIIAARPSRPPTSRWVIGGDGDVDASLSTTIGRAGASPPSPPATWSPPAT